MNSPALAKTSPARINVNIQRSIYPKLSRSFLKSLGSPHRPTMFRSQFRRKQLQGSRPHSEFFNKVPKFSFLPPPRIVFPACVNFYHVTLKNKSSPPSLGSSSSNALTSFGVLNPFWIALTVSRYICFFQICPQNNIGIEFNIKSVFQVLPVKTVYKSTPVHTSSK